MKNQIFTKRKLSQGITQYVLITVLIALLGAYFGYQNYVEYQSARAALALENEKLLELRGTAEQTKTSYLTLKKELDAQNAGINQSIELILPSNEDFTDLARQLDKYFLNTNLTVNPMFLSNLSFAQPNTQGAEFAVLPFSISLSGTENGLKEFLRYVENSGDLNDKTRLLDFSDINLSYISEEASPEGALSGESTALTPSSLAPARKVNASLGMRAYFQKPLELANSPAN